MKKIRYTYNVDAILSDLDLRKERRELVAFINQLSFRDGEYQEALDRIKAINRELDNRKASRAARAKAVQQLNVHFSNGVKLALIGLGVILLYLAYHFTK
jgi:uncharacterized protein (DUF3084 family)